MTVIAQRGRTLYTKKNQTGFADALYRETEGLELLREAIAVAGISGIQVPDVHSVTDERMEMTAIASLRQTDELLRRLGQGLAALHGLPQEGYGLERDNYIGLNRQKNRQSESWGDFFVEYRLGYQVSLITDPQVRDRFASVLGQKGALLAQWLEERCQGPSLLHGDLWSGNALFDSDNAWLIDPAVYYGDSEVDLAMTEMFGGFGPSFYEAYDQVRPLSRDYGLKRDIYNLYHFLNHYNLFGGWYLGPCEKALVLIGRL